MVQWHHKMAYYHPVEKSATAVTLRLEIWLSPISMSNTSLVSWYQIVIDLDSARKKVFYSPRWVAVGSTFPPLTSCLIRCLRLVISLLKAACQGGFPGIKGPQSEREKHDALLWESLWEYAFMYIHLSQMQLCAFYRLLDQGFTDFLRVGSMKKIAQPILPYR